MNSENLGYNFEWLDYVGKSPSKVHGSWVEAEKLARPALTYDQLRICANTFLCLDSGEHYVGIVLGKHMAMKSDGSVRFWRVDED